MPKIGKNARDIFASTASGPNQDAASTAGDTREPELISVTSDVGQADVLEGVEAVFTGRGRPQLHQEPTSKITTVLLNRHVVYLDGISNEIRQKSGSVVKRSEILRALIEALEAAQPDLKEVRSQADLTEILRLRLK